MKDTDTLGHHDKQGGWMRCAEERIVNESKQLIDKRSPEEDASNSLATHRFESLSAHVQMAESIVRLVLQEPRHPNSVRNSPIVIDLDLYELQSRINTLIAEAAPVYEFDGCQLSTGMRQLKREGRAIHLRPKVYQLLIHLIERRSRAVSRDELCEQIWTGRCVGNATVDSTIKALRHAVGDDGSTQRLVQTISGYGYRFVAAVKTCVPADRMLRASLPFQQQSEVRCSS